MFTLKHAMRNAALRFWQGLRQWSGDAAYETYRKCADRAGQPALSPTEFYVEQLNKKYSRPNRCC
jgi:uncharacterized short protein YbdD (DUF466 family)